LGPWLDSHPKVGTFVVVGGCTDKCTGLPATVLNQGGHVIVPVDCAAIYDLPVDAARDTGAVAHDGDLLHHVILYHMLLNGPKEVSALE
jgi:hypothetical protein